MFTFLRALEIPSENNLLSISTNTSFCGGHDTDKLWNTVTTMNSQAVSGRLSKQLSHFNMGVINFRTQELLTPVGSADCVSRPFVCVSTHNSKQSRRRPGTVENTSLLLRPSLQRLYFSTKLNWQGVMINTFNRGPKPPLMENKSLLGICLQINEFS